MASPGGPPPYYPPTTSQQPPQQAAYAPPGYAPGYAPPPGYAVAVARQKPSNVGIAGGCTIAVGVVALLTGIAVLVVALFLQGLFDAFVLGEMGWLTGFLGFFSLLPLVFGAIAIGAGVGLNNGNPSSWGTAMVVNVLSVIFAVITLTGGGVTLVTGALSGVALWALYQPDVKAYFGQA